MSACGYLPSIMPRIPILMHTWLVFSFMWQVCGYLPSTMPKSKDVLLQATQLTASFVLETLIHSKEKVACRLWDGQGLCD